MSEHPIIKQVKRELKIAEGNVRPAHHTISMPDAHARWLIERYEEMLKLERFKEYFDELYGIGLEIAEWHTNGNLESFDGFYEVALEEMEII